MPEGDSVWRLAARLRPVLVGKQLVRCDIRVPRPAELDFTGSPVDSIATVGRHLLMRVAGAVIHTHMRMDGVWQIGSPVQRWRRPAHQARIILATEQTLVIGFTLGLVEVLSPAGEAALRQRIGPDPLGEQWDCAEVVRRLQTRPDQPLGLALLDQHTIAGIGNIYRSEICFTFGADPRTPVSAVPDLPRLAAVAHRTMRTAAQGRPMRFQVYRRHRQPCLRCGTAIERYPLGGPPAQPYSERWIYVCPHCQPRPDAA